MDTRRTTKRQVIALRTMLRSNVLSEEQRQGMLKNIVELRNKLDSVDSHIDPAEIAARRDFLNKNKGMLDVFNTFWVILLVHTTDGYLSKEGYTKFHRAIEIALAGEATFKEIDQQTVDIDWTYDKLLYGNLNKLAFFDMLFEIIETWTEIVDPTYYASFSWALLDSVADTAAHPPRLRPFREMRCITKLENEASMIKNYVKNKKLRAALSIESDIMQRIPDVQKRLHARKHGHGFDDVEASMLEALSLQAAAALNTEFVDSLDSDGESLHTATSLHQELMLQQQSWQDDDDREEDDIEDDEEFERFEDSDSELAEGEQVADQGGAINPSSSNALLGSPASGSSKGFRRTSSRLGTMSDELDQEDDAPGINAHLSENGSPITGGGKGLARRSRNSSQYVMRKPTASFMAYCQKRRSTRVLLNGVYGVDGMESLQSSLAAASQNTGSGIIDMSAQATLPSYVSKTFSDTHSESDCSYQTSNNDESPSGRSLSAVTQVVINIDSPTRTFSNPTNPYGGNVGDKARFSQFLASGKRLGSFAKQYLQTHNMNSGLGPAEYSSSNGGGGKGIPNTINSQRMLSDGAKNGKHSTHKAHPHSQSMGQLATLVEESLNPSPAMSDFSLLGKSMYVLPTQNNTGAVKPAPKQKLQAAGLTQKSLSAARASGALGVAQINTDFPILPQNKSGNGPPSVDSILFTDGGDVNTNSAASSPSTSAKEERRRERMSPSSRGNAPIITATVSGKGSGNVSVAAEEGAEFGDVVDDGTSKYFNVHDTQLSSLSSFRRELTSELLSQNASYKAVDAKNNKPAAGGKKKKMTPRGLNVPALQAPERGNRGCFLLVESRAPPVEKTTAVFRARSRGTSASPPQNIHGMEPYMMTPPSSSQHLAMSQSLSELPPRSSASFDSASQSDSERGGSLTRNQSEILAPEIPVASVINLLSPAPKNASFDALFGHPGHPSKASGVSKINFPFGPPIPDQVGIRARSNSNVSYADSDISLESIQQLESMELFYTQYGSDRDVLRAQRGGLPGRAVKDDIAYSDTMTSPPASRLHGRPVQSHLNKKISPLIVLDASISASRQRGRDSVGPLDGEKSLDTNAAQASRPKRGTNAAILQPHHLPMKPEYSTFPQGMYYNVVKHALDLRQQPNFAPSWDHSRASKAVRLTALKRPVDASLSLTTAAMNVSNANKLAEVIKNTEHHQKILGGEQKSAPKKPPLMINITSNNGDPLKLGSALENPDISKVFSGSAGDSLSASIAATVGSRAESAEGSLRAAVLQRGSFAVPSASEIRPSMLSGNAIPAPDALMESLVRLHSAPMNDDIVDVTPDPLGGSLSGSSSLNTGSQSNSPSKAHPNLLIKPVAATLNVHQNQPIKPDKESSPPKTNYVDNNGKLRVKDVNFFQKDMFEIHHDIQVIQSTGKSTATQFGDSQQIPNQVSSLVPIKHPYLTMNGTKHVLPDKMVASIVSARNKSVSHYELDGGQAESVFLGNSSGMLVRDSTLGHTSDYPSHSIPWLPRGTLEPVEHDRSNQIIGKREHLDLQRYSQADPSRQVLTIRSQRAIREAFEGYVQQRMHAQYNTHQPPAPMQLHQLDRPRQEVLLQQLQIQKTPSQR